jgi:Uma2 family endonuclease
MSIAEQPRPAVAPPTPPSPALPPLIEGQRLDQPTFHARYAAMPSETRAELINGVVCMASPLFVPHSRAQVAALVWLSYYAETTPGVEALDNASTILGPRGEAQPDLQLRVLPEHGGRTQPDPKVVRGAPELVVEVAHSSRYKDFGPKFEDYEHAYVLEYAVVALEPDEVVWHVLQDGRLTSVLPDADGLYRSRVFPGLWLDPQALLAGDTRRLREVVDLGVATPEHAAFVAQLAAARIAT